MIPVNLSLELFALREQEMSVKEDLEYIDLDIRLDAQRPDFAI